MQARTPQSAHAKRAKTRTNAQYYAGCIITQNTQVRSHMTASFKSSLPATTIELVLNYFLPESTSRLARL